MELYKGVIEDNKDPEKRGRYKVRVFGLHTEIKEKTKTEGIPTEELMWAEVMASPQNPMVNGIGINWILPQGTWVLLTFLDDNFQRPIIIGTIASSIPTEKPNPKIGFNDPDGKYPKEDYLNEPDVNRLVRNEKIDKTYVQKRKENKMKNITEADGNKWNEPDPAYNSQYPNNKVIETEKGIIVEFDDTPGEERIHIYHPSNSFIEIDKEGNKIIKTTGNYYILSLKDMKLYCGGELSISVDGNIKIKGERTLIKTDEMEIDSKSIKLGKNANKGCVGVGDFCPFIGKHVKGSFLTKTL